MNISTQTKGLTLFVISCFLKKITAARVSFSTSKVCKSKHSSVRKLVSLPCGEGRNGLDPPDSGEALILPHVGNPFEQQ